MSKRRPTGLTAEQTAPVTSNPHVRRLTIQLRNLRPGSESALRSLKQKLNRKLKQKIRDDWTDEQAVDDIERQLQGKGFATSSGSCNTSSAASSEVADGSA